MISLARGNVELALSINEFAFKMIGHAIYIIYLGLPIALHPFSPTRDWKNGVVVFIPRGSLASVGY